jgi:hypothetical protein
MRKFSLVDPESGSFEGEYLSQTPRGAALKATTKGKTGIFYLVEVDNGNLHAFKGSLRTLSENEHTSFTRSHNIVHKPSVSKIAYERGSGDLSTYNLARRVKGMCGSETNKDFDCV